MNSMHVKGCKIYQILAGKPYSSGVICYMMLVLKR